MPYINQPASALSAGSVPIADIANPGTGKVIGSSGGAAAAVFPPGFELDYVQITSGVNVTGTASATPTTIITGTSQAYAATRVKVEFYSVAVILPDALSVTDSVNIDLWDMSGAGARLMALGFVELVMTGTAQTLGTSLFCSTFFTPSAATHQYAIRAYANSVTGTPSIAAGAGTAGASVPAYLRITVA